MNIRRMLIEDLPQLAKLYKQFWNENSDTERMRLQFEKMRENDAVILLSAVDNNVLIGSVMGIICEELYGACKPFLVLENLIVDKRHRKKSVGKSLFLEIERIAKEKYCEQIILVTESNRVDACSFYEAVGFSPETNKGYKKKI